jgi:hypothetical protein
MALDPKALVTLADFKAFGGWTGSNKDDAMERAINAASAFVGNHLGRTLCDASLLTPWARTEYHSFDAYTNELWMVDWPIVSITSVHEDASRAYGAAALLVENTDYVVDKPQGRLYRVSSSAGPGTWAIGWEAVKVIGVLGYRDHAGLPVAAGTVPSDIKDVVCWVAGRLFQEAEQKRFDVQSATDATGTVTRFSASRLPPMMQDVLASHRARPGTGRRAA